MEHAIYLCNWRREGSDFVIWLSDNSLIRAKGTTFGEAIDNLLSAISQSGGAMQALLEFDPPLPKTDLEVTFCSAEVVSIYGDEPFRTDTEIRGSPVERTEKLRILNDFFSKPVCEKCLFSSGIRSDRPLDITSLPHGIDGAYGFLGAHMIYIFSEGFLSALAPAEKSGFEFRRVKRRGKAFYELVGPFGPRYVMPAGLKSTMTKCPLCGHCKFGVYERDFPIHDFIAKEDLPRPIPSLFSVGTEVGATLAMPVSRWRELRGRTGFRGITSTAIGIATNWTVC